MNTKLENVSLIEDYNGWITGSYGVSRRIDGRAYRDWETLLIIISIRFFLASKTVCYT